MQMLKASAIFLRGNKILLSITFIIFSLFMPEVIILSQPVKAALCQMTRYSEVAFGLRDILYNRVMNNIEYPDIINVISI